MASGAGWAGFSKAAILFLSMMGVCWAAPTADLISSLPGQPNVPFAQYAGYITIDAAAGRSFFYYFVEADSDPSSKPLTLWLNGGPGCSSIGNGAFTENGPFRVTSGDGELAENPYAWNKASNVLFLDSPAGVGWSFSNTSEDLVTNDVATAQDNFLFLQNWFEAFPEYKGRNLYITGESYAGHYGPQLASLIVDYIAEKGPSMFNLVAMAIGNPLLNGLVDFQETVFFQWSHGLISDSTYTSVMGNCNFSIASIPNEACAAALAEADREVTVFVDPYDVLIDVCLPPSMQQGHRLQQSRKTQQNSQKRLKESSILDVCMDDELIAYMNLPSVQQAFHANTTGLSYRWCYCNEGSLKYDRSGFDESMLPVLSHILEGGVSILIYSGDVDTVIPFGGTRRMTDQLAVMNNLTTTLPYTAWVDKGQVGGWTQVYGPLSYATVRGAAHMVPYTSPSRALTLFQSFLAGTSLPLAAATRSHAAI